jgi:ribosomal protein S6--L-glutamate ligase
LSHRQPHVSPGHYRLIKDNDQLRALYGELGAGDLFIGRLRLHPSEENLLVDLQSRGVTLFPSGLAQLLCRSKVMQATVFAGEMLPETRAIHDLHELMQLLPHYQRQGITRVVTKRDRANAGLGINLWGSLEEVFNQASLGALPFPFVVQPFYEKCRDIRVVMLGDYREAYWRDNPDNFRNNLHFGGKSTPAELSEAQEALCNLVLARGAFPYAHLDLMVTADQQSYLAEINLRGGIRGAAISAAEYRQRIEAIHQQFQAGLELEA